MKEEKEPKNKHEEMTDLLDLTKKGLGMASTAAKGMGESLPAPVGKIAKAAGIVSGAIKDPADNWVEKAVCGTTKVLVQGALAAPLTGVVAVEAAVAMPVKHPFAMGGAAVIAVAGAGPAINEAAKPYGEAAAKGCHAGFDAFRKPKEARKQEAQKKIHQKHSQNNVINSFHSNVSASKAPSWQSSYTPYVHRSFYFHMPFNPKSEINRILLQYPRITFSDRLYIENRVESSLFFSRTGFGHALGASSFHSTLSMTGLIPIYNSYNIQSLVHEAVRSCGKIGGVAGDVALINDLVDSDAHAMAEEYFFCFKANEPSINPALIKQIEKELNRNYFIHKTLPFFSLHFNNQGFSYPVIHPAYTDTLIGKIISILDYWMKGFLNGGIFKEEFLKKWHELQNCDEKHLRENLIDLKKYCKENVKEVSYMSIRELESRYGLKLENLQISSLYQNAFMGSFRIIAFQQEIKRHGNILVPSPDFRVETSIEMSPDYKEYIEKYHKEHGEYPRDHENLKRCYALFTEEIKEKLPQMPFCRDYFYLLGIINAYSYAFTTFEKMGKQPVLPDLDIEAESEIVPKAFPPYPIRRPENLDWPLSFGMIAQNLMEPDQIDTALFALFADRQLRKLPDNLIQKLGIVIQKLLQTEIDKKFPSGNVEMNEAEINRITKQTERFIYTQIIQTHGSINRILSRLLQKIPAAESGTVNKLFLPKKLEATEVLLNKQKPLTKAIWEKAESLSLPEILKVFTEDWHEVINETFKKLDAELNAELEFVIFSAKKAAGALTVAELQNPPAPPKEGLGKLCQNLALEFKEFSTLIDAHFTNQVTSIQQKIQALMNLLQNRQNLINSAQQEINRINALKTGEIAKIPFNLRAINAKNIAKFSAPIDQEVARLQGLIAGFQQDINLINADLTNLGTALAATPAEKILKQKEASEAWLKDKLAAYQQESIQVRKAAWKEQALDLLEQIHEQNIAKINRFKHIIQHFHTTLTNDPDIAKHPVSTKYNYTVIDFDNNNQKDNFRIIGGCRISVPNLQSRPLENGEAFSQALAEALAAEASEFVFEKQKYQISTMQVRDVNKIKPVATETQQILTELMKGDIEAKTLNERIKMKAVDASGSRLMHYAAAVLDTETFNILAGKEILTTDSLGNTALHYAAQAGNTEIVREILSKHPELRDCKNKDGVTALLMAVQQGQLDTLKLLHLNGANINKRLPNGLFPLYVAIQKNQEAMASWMLEIPVIEINEEICSKMTALHLAIDAGFEALALKLINKGANCTIKRKSDGFNAMHTAVSHGKISLLMAMVKQGVSLQSKLESGKTALHIAAESGLSDCLDYLLGEKLDPNAKTIDGDTALMLAIKAGQFEAAKKLAVLSAIDTVNEENQTASILAIQYGMAQVGDILMAKGENPEIRDKKGLNYTYFLLRNGEESRFSALWNARKINPNQEYQGQNTLEIAAKYGQFLLVYDLLPRVSFRQKAKSPSLLEYAVMANESGYLIENTGMGTDYSHLANLAARQGSDRCLSWLLKKCPAETVLIAALESGKSKILEMVLRSVRDLNKVVDSKANTPLHLAAINGFVDAIDLLLDSGANPVLKNQAGKTAFDLAFQQDDLLLLKRLLKKTKPGEWPRSLWQQAEKPSAGMQKLLTSYKKRLPEKIRNEQTVLAEKKSLSSLVMTETLGQGLSLLKALFDESNFEEAANLLEENPKLLELFKSVQGADLILRIFKNIHDFKNLIAENSELSADRLLYLLQRAGIDPGTYTGKNNVLLAMVRAEDEEEACFRLKLFLKNFPNSLPSLLKDEKASIMELALKLNLRKLFEALDAAGPSSPEEKPVNGLHEAVKANNYDLTETMLKRYPADSLNAQKQTPLMFAAALNNIRIIELLLEKGALPDRQDLHGKNALHHALDNQSEAAALSLIPLLRHKNQADRQQRTPLMLAASEGMLSVVHCLTELGDFRESYDKKGHNALHYAALDGQEKIIEYLVNHGYSPNQIEGGHPKKPEKDCKRTPLHLAAARGKEASVRKLLDLGADQKQEDALQNTVCEHAILSRNEETWRLIQTLPVYHERERDTSLLLASAAADHLEMAAILILGDANMNATNSSGLGALHFCAINNSAKVADLLLQGGDLAIDARDLSGHTPLHYAAQTGHVRLIELLCEAKASVNARNSQKSTALYMACEEGMKGAVLALLKYQADFSLVNGQGITPGQIALFNGHLQLAKLLKDLGDKSLCVNAVEKLPEFIKDKILSEHRGFLQVQPEQAVSMSKALSRYGLYRMQAVAEEEAIVVAKAVLVS